MNSRASSNPFPTRTDKMTPHKHQYTVPVEWRELGFGPVVVTRLRCNSCNKEINRPAGETLPKDIL